MTEHTPTPWKIGRYGKVQSEGMPDWDSINVSGFALCNWEEAEANARHIIRCVNYHDRLVNFLSELTSACTALGFEAGRVDMPVQSAKDILEELEQQP